jgi:hypothetical protein
MPGLVPGIHVFLSLEAKTWMAGTKPGHDEFGMSSRRTPGPIPRGLSFRHCRRGLFSLLRPGVMGPCVRRDDPLRDCASSRFNFQTAKALNVIASEAKQSIEQQRKNRLLRRFAPRNDVKTQLRILAARCARVVHEPFALRKQRAQGMPGARCTRSLACKVESTRA